MNSADSGNMLLLLSAVDQSMNDSVNANSEPLLPGLAWGTMGIKPAELGHFDQFF